MKNKILIIIAIISFSNTAISGKLGFDVGSGLKSNYGLLGLGLRYFPVKNFDLYLTSGVDITGITTTVGTRLYSNPIGNKCFFFITCTPLYYIGIHGGRTSGGEITIENDGSEAKYDFGQGYFTGLNIGLFDLFSDWFYYSLDISYRSYYDSPSIDHVSGVKKDDDLEDLEELIKPGLGLGISIGVLF